jgi:predicted CoA-substrate-specific enzyme activase
MARFMGIDIGSGTSKGVIAKDKKLEVYHILASGVNYRMASLKLREELLAKAGLGAEDIVRTVTTGHGADIIPFSNRHVADIQCCARGINSIFPSVRTVIDVQGQSSQVIRVDERGQVTGFTVSEACASGSGCFIEVIANVLQVKLEDIGPLSLYAKNPVTFTTGCAVFGESEAISRVAEGVPKEDILAGVHQALADKIFTLIDRIGLKEPCAISGGGGLNGGLIKRIEELGVQLLIPPQPQIVNALGAALIAGEQDF